MPGTWDSLSERCPVAAGLMLLLTDGTVMVQESSPQGSAFWWRLHPDPMGSYRQGHWLPMTPMRIPRTYFATAVLRDGRVFAAGGKYIPANVTGPDLFTPAELYDPIADVWIDAAPFPLTFWSMLRDPPSTMLADGRVLLGNAIELPKTALFDPSLDPPRGRWRPAASRPGNHICQEETWTLLPDGSVLVVECHNAPASVRYRPADNDWVSAGDTCPEIVDGISNEIGPALLLPDGRVFAVGANGKTSLYSPQAGERAQQWSVGPEVRTRDGALRHAKDAPGCLLPSGRVLFAAGPAPANAKDYPGPTFFFEFDGTNVQEVGAPETSVVAAGEREIAPYEGQFLILPNGEALFSNGRPELAIYRSTDPTCDQWPPRITDVPGFLACGSVYELRGQQINGLSQAVSYGDDITAATSYPLVRIHARIGGSVRYCPTFDHSTMGVATGDAVHSTRFQVPWDATPGDYDLCVVANGIASEPRRVTVADCRSRSRLGGRQIAEELRARSSHWDDDAMRRIAEDLVSGVEALAELERARIDALLKESTDKPVKRERRQPG